MNEYHEYIINVVEEMRKEGYRKENVQVYLAIDVFHEISSSDEFVRYNPPTSNRHIQTEESTFSSNSLDPSEYSAEFETYEIIKFEGMRLLEEPRLNDGEILILNTDALREHSSGRIMIEHPACIEKIRTKTVEKEIECYHCGESTTDVVEGDGDDVYCSVKCLNNRYS